MRRASSSFILLLLLLGSLHAQAPAAIEAPPAAQGSQQPAAEWWAHVQYLAGDEMEGRQTGSPGHRKAADYAVLHFRKAGLKPAGAAGFFQTVDFISLRLDEERTRIALIRDGAAEPLALRRDILVNLRASPASQPFEAPLVFVGYGLQIPELGIDDFAGLDVRGKLIVRLSGAPPGIPDNLRSHYMSAAERAATARNVGALGMLAITIPARLLRAAEAPAPAAAQAAASPAEEAAQQRAASAPARPVMVLADPQLDDHRGILLSAGLTMRKAAAIFAGSQHSLEELIEILRAGKPLPRFPLATSLRSHLAIERTPVRSENVVAVMPGRDPRLRDEYVVLSAHIDHIGTVETPEGTHIYNGAMDNASGVATLLEVASRLGSLRPRRSVIFLLVTGEEHGLLGSKYFASYPTVPRPNIVANINVDMFSPLFPLTRLIVNGLGESDLGEHARAVGKGLGIEVIPHPEPQQNSFIRSDQYSFIRAGVPAISSRVGYSLDSPQHKTVAEWMRTRYHRPSDDLTQPVDFNAAAAFNQMMLRLTERVANAQRRPRWNHDSFFRRYAQPAAGGSR